MYVCKYMSICIYVCKYMSICIYVCKYMSICIYVCKYMSISIYVCKYMSISIYVCKYMYVCMYVCMHVCITCIITYSISIHKHLKWMHLSQSCTTPSPYLRSRRIHHQADEEHWHRPLRTGAFSIPKIGETSTVLQWCMVILNPKPIAGVSQVETPNEKVCKEFAYDLVIWCMLLTMPGNRSWNPLSVDELQNCPSWTILAGGNNHWRAVPSAKKQDAPHLHIANRPKHQQRTKFRTE